MQCQRIASGKAVSTSGRGRAAQAPVRNVAGRRAAPRVNASTPGFEKAAFGEDFGARDPFAGEIESNFGEKVLGNYNTEHIIKPPDAIGKVLGLAARRVADLQPALLDEATRDRLRQQVPGWRVSPQGDSIQQEWTLKDAAAAAQLVESIAALAAAEGHAPASVEVVGAATVAARLTTPAVGGLSEADFVIAAKINSMELSPLLAKRKQRFWA